VIDAGLCERLPPFLVQHQQQGATSLHEGHDRLHLGGRELFRGGAKVENAGARKCRRRDSVGRRPDLEAELRGSGGHCGRRWQLAVGLIENDDDASGTRLLCRQGIEAVGAEADCRKEERRACHAILGV
jgi:hypothetical protein